MSNTKHNARKNSGKRHIFKTILWLTFSLGILYAFIKLQSFVVNPDQFQTTVSFEVSEVNTTRIVSRQGNSTEEQTLVFIAVLSHWREWRRRQSIRETWMTGCSEGRAKCLFFTDDIGAKGNDKQWLQTELSWNNDIILMPMTEDMSFAFGARLLWILQWAMNHSNFEYFLRIDDDHFLCLERLLYELPSRPKQALYWGFVHCKPKIVRVDEAWLMITRDLVVEILGKINTTLPCHPVGDQAMAMWINNSTYNVTYFMDNTRIVHKTAGHDTKYYTRTVCEEYISLHGVFSVEMRKLWLVWFKLYRAKLKSMPSYKINPIQRFEKLCRHSKMFSVSGFYPEYRFEPRLCRLNPTWSISKSVYAGREQTGERYSSY